MNHGLAVSTTCLRTTCSCERAWRDVGTRTAHRGAGAVICARSSSCFDIPRSRAPCVALASKSTMRSRSRRRSTFDSRSPPRADRVGDRPVAADHHELADVRFWGAPVIVPAERPNQTLSSAIVCVPRTVAVTTAMSELIRKLPSDRRPEAAVRRASLPFHTPSA